MMVNEKEDKGACPASPVTALPALRASKPAAFRKVASTGAEDTYRGWEVRRGRWPEPEWLAEHPNYDASWEGEEDGWVDNGLKADAPTYEALCEEIDIIEEERGA